MYICSVECRKQFKEINLSEYSVRSLTEIRIGFVNTCTIEDVRRAYPFLDMVDHENRRRVVSINMLILFHFIFIEKMF